MYARRSHPLSDVSISWGDAHSFIDHPASRPDPKPQPRGAPLDVGVERLAAEAEFVGVDVGPLREQERAEERHVGHDGLERRMAGAGRHVLRDARLRGEVEAGRIGKRIVYSRDELLRFTRSTTSEHFIHLDA